MSILKIELNNQFIGTTVRVTYKIKGVVNTGSWLLADAPESVRKIVKGFKDGQVVWSKDSDRFIELLLDLDLNPNSEFFKAELNNAIEASLAGLSYKRIVAMVEERVENQGLRA